MKKKPLLFLGILVSVAVVSWYIGKGDLSHLDEKVSTEDTDDQKFHSDEQENVNLLKRNRSIASNIRNQIQQVIDEEIPPLKTQEKVINYLNLLRRQVLTKREVTALEVEVGIAAIQSLEEDLGVNETAAQIDAFTKEMARYSIEFGHVAEMPQAPSRQELDEKWKEIFEETENEWKQESIQEYFSMIDAVEDADTRLDLMSDIQQKLTAENITEKAPDFDELANKISEAPDDGSKQQAIKDFLTGVELLDPNDQILRMDQLNKLTKQHKE